MRNTILFVAMLVVSVPSAAQRQRLTLREAGEIALKNHPSISAANFAALAASAVPAQHAAARQPIVSASLTGVGAPDNNRLGAGAINNPIIYSRIGTGLNISHLLVDFGRTSHLVESSTFRARSAEEDKKAVEGRILLEVNRGYFDALRTESVLQVAERTVEARQLVVDQVTELARARLKSELDVSFARVNLEEAKLLVATAQNERRAAYARLSATLGYQDVIEFELAEERFLIEPLAASELIAKALRERPEVRSQNLLVEASSRFAKAERASTYPTISAIGSAGLIPQRNSALRSNYLAAGINVTLPFMNGGLLRAREAEAQMRARAEQERLRDLQTQIIRDIRIAILDVNTAAEQVRLTQQLHEQAARALELAQARYDLGLSSIVELSQAQLALTSAEIQHTNSQYNYHIRRAMLDFQAGVRP